METLDATVLICTYNRATLLAETLDSLAESLVPHTCAWDVLVVDNNSTDETARVVNSRVREYPVPLRYLFEPAQGKSHALNLGIRASSSRVIVFTDDDVRVEPTWLTEAIAPLIGESDDVQYTGGPVRPIWGAPRPTWLGENEAGLWGTIAILDYGPEPFGFEERRKVPLGANMAVKRALIERVGGFRPDLGRRGRLLLGQEQGEFFCRTRAVSARGLYVPGMVVHHHVPAARLTRRYFRRWWFGKGVSKARLEELHPITELGLDLRAVPHIFGVPRYLFGSAARDALNWLRALAAFSSARRLRDETRLCYFAGYLYERWSRPGRVKAKPLATSAVSETDTQTSQRST